MTQENAQYLNFVTENNNTTMYSGPVESGDLAYFVKVILPNLRPLSEGEYVNGPAVILNTLARYSYLLYKNDLYWCAEWAPGLVVVRFCFDRSMAWCALRSPVPSFGGREPEPADAHDYDEDAENPQYNLVFRSWDAQFDEDWRKWRSFQPADNESVRMFETLTQHANSLYDEKVSRLKGDFEKSAWFEQCKKNLRDWSGDGIRVQSKAKKES